MKSRKTITNYPAGDFLIRLKNIAMSNKSDVTVSSTKFIHALAEALKDEGFLQEVKLEEGILKVKLAVSHKSPVLTDLKLISKPGLRVYATHDKIAERKLRSSILLLSTPKGIMSNYKAVKNNLGGEVIAEVW